MGNDQSIAKEDFDSILSGTKYGPDEIKALYKSFMQQFPKGRITRLEFMNTYSRCFANYREAVEFTDHVFRVYDDNGDGVVTFKEFLTSMGVAARGEPKERLEWAFKMYDIDDNGTISHKELIEILTALYRAKGRNDPKSKALVSARTIMKAADIDRSGGLTLNEFVEGAIGNPDINALLQGK